MRLRGRLRPSRPFLKRQLEDCGLSVFRNSATEENVYAAMKEQLRSFFSHTAGTAQRDGYFIVEVISVSFRGQFLLELFLRRSSNRFIFLFY